MIRPLVWAFGASVLGEILAGMSTWQVLVLSALSALAVTRFFRRGGQVRTILWAALFFCLGFLRVSLWQEAEPADVPERESLWFSGRVGEIGRSGDSWYLDLRQEGGDGGIRFFWDQEPCAGEELLLPSDQVMVRGTVQKFSTATNPGQFDARAWYLAKGLQLSGKPEETVLRNRPAISPDALLYRLRQTLEKGLRGAAARAGLSEGDASIGAALILGNRSEVQQEDKDLFDGLGISHILTISGLHVSLLGEGLYTVLMCLPGFSCHLARILAGLFTIAYGRMSCGGTAGVRAVAMFLVHLWARRRGKYYDPASAGALAGMLLLWDQPLWLYQSGFQLSFAGVGAASILWPFLRRWWERSSERPLGEAGSACLFGLCMQGTLLPFLLWHRYEYAGLSVPANLVALPLLPWILASGGAACVLGLFLPGVGSACLWPFRLGLAWYRMMGAIAEKLPGSRLILGRPYAWQIFVWAGITLAILRRMAVGADGREKEGSREEKAVRLIREKNAAQKKLLRISPAAGNSLRMAAFLLYLILSLAILKRPDPAGLSFSLLDVGQGECILLHTAQSAILVDAGSSSDKKAGERRIVPFLKEQGASHLDAVILTHLDDDHINALSSLWEAGIAIDRVLLSPCHESREEWEALCAKVQEAGISAGTLQAGDDYREKVFSFTCLYPGPKEKVQEENEASLVLLVESGKFSTLITGDLPGSREEEVLQAMQQKDPVTVLVAAHHGSRASTGEEFLDALRPANVLISCAEKNRYGHPHPELLERLRKAGCQVFTTPQCGCITFEVEGETIRFIPYKE